jgi:hypothetical protein
VVTTPHGNYEEYHTRWFRHNKGNRQYPLDQDLSIVRLYMCEGWMEGSHERTIHRAEKSYLTIAVNFPPSRVCGNRIRRIDLLLSEVSDESLTERVVVDLGIGDQHDDSELPGREISGTIRVPSFPSDTGVVSRRTGIVRHN